MKAVTNMVINITVHTRQIRDFGEDLVLSSMWWSSKLSCDSASSSPLILENERCVDDISFVDFLNGQPESNCLETAKCMILGSLIELERCSIGVENYTSGCEGNPEI